MNDLALNHASFAPVDGSGSGRDVQASAGVCVWCGAKTGWHARTGKRNKYCSRKCIHSAWISDNRQKRRLHLARHYALHKKTIAEYHKQLASRKYKTDPKYRLSKILRSRLYSATRSLGIKKKTTTSNMLGCSVVEFKSWIESQFTGKMSWKNYGKLWEIDHIVPVASCKTNAEMEACFHYSNMRPLMKHDNRKKSWRVVPCQPQLQLKTPAISDRGCNHEPTQG